MGVQLRHFAPKRPAARRGPWDRTPESLSAILPEVQSAKGDATRGWAYIGLCVSV
jgi:hypothetical protein